MLVDDDAARLDGEPELGGQLGARVDADADDHDVGVQHGAVGELDPDGVLVLTDEADSAGAQQDPRAAAFVRVADGVGQQRCDRPAEQAVARLDDGHRGAERAGARGDLEPDEATPDDDDLARLAEPGRQPVGVSQGAHRVDPVELGAVDGERPVDGARAQGEAVEPERAARGGDGAASTGIPLDRRHGVAGDELDAEVGEPRGVVEDERGAVVLAAQVALRQRGAFVGRVGLVTDEDDRLDVPELAQGRDERDGGLARADDERPCRLVPGHGCHPRVGA